MGIGHADAGCDASVQRGQEPVSDGGWRQRKSIHGKKVMGRRRAVGRLNRPCCRTRLNAQNSKVKWLAWSPVSPSVSAPVPSTECSSGPGLAVQIRSKAHLRRAAYCTTVGDSSLSFLFTSTRQCLQFVVAVSNTFVCLFVEQEHLSWGLQGALSLALYKNDRD